MIFEEKVSMIKIASPLSKSREIAPLAKAGADEFYCCVATEQWRSFYGMVESISRRNNPFAHLSSYDELERVLKLSCKYGIKVHAVLNEVYHRDQMDYLLEQVNILHSMKVDAVILGDIASLLAVREAGIPIKIFMGTGGTIFNSQTVKLYESLGVKRMILPRHLSILEISKIISYAPGPEYEVFIFRGLCPYIDGFCRFQHGINETLGRKPRVNLACALKYRIKTIVEKGKKIAPARRSRIKELMSPRQSLTGCGLCALFDLIRINGITSLKIVGREFSTKEKIDNLKMVRRSLEVFQERPGISREDYTALCRENFQEFFERECGFKDCYYPLSYRSW